MRQELHNAVSRSDPGVRGGPHHHGIERHGRGKNGDQDDVAGPDGQTVHDHRSKNGSDEDGEQREEFDQAVGADEVFPRKDFRKNAVFGGAVDCRPDADQKVSGSLPHIAEPHAEAAHGGAEDLQQVASEQPRGLGKAIVEVTGQRGQEHVGDKQQAGVERASGAEVVQGEGAGLLKQGQLSHDHRQDRVVAKGAEELADQQQRVVAPSGQIRSGTHGAPSASRAAPASALAAMARRTLAACAARCSEMPSHSRAAAR